MMSSPQPGCQHCAACDRPCVLQEAEVLLLQHHHAAEPANTIQQAGRFHKLARCVPRCQRMPCWDRHVT